MQNEKVDCGEVVHWNINQGRDCCYLGHPWSGLLLDVGEGLGLGSDPTDIRDTELAGEKGASSLSLS